MARVTCSMSMWKAMPRRYTAEILLNVLLSRKPLSNFRLVITYTLDLPCNSEEDLFAYHLCQSHEYHL